MSSEVKAVPQYDRSPEFNQDEGEVMSQAPEIGALAVLNKSEIDQQIATAKQYPRNLTKFRREAMQLVALDEPTASECIYALPRDGKTIEGPSARFAEIINYAWGNTRAGARTISEEGDFVKSQGLFYDLEKNTAISYEVSRRITDRKGRRYSADMVGTTSNAACSIALRNAILKGIPKALWKPLYDAARKVVAGDIQTLANRRADTIKEFAIFGVTPEKICHTLQVEGVQDIGLEQLVVLKGILTAIKEGETTPEQAFANTGGVSPDTTGMSEEEAKLVKDAEETLRKHGMNGARATVWIQEHKATLKQDLEKIKAADATKPTTEAVQQAKQEEQPKEKKAPAEDPLTFTQEDQKAVEQQQKPASKPQARRLF